MRTLSTPRVTSRNRRVVLDDDEEDDEDQPPLESIEVEANSKIFSPEIPIDPLPSRAHSETQVVRSLRPPRPRFEYPVPKELEGVRQALGLDNWNEYLLHMENLWTGECTGEEFAARTKPLFMVLDDTIRRKLNNLMAMKSVVPVLEQHANDGNESKKVYGQISQA